MLAVLSYFYANTALCPPGGISAHFADSWKQAAENEAEHCVFPKVRE